MPRTRVIDLSSTNTIPENLRAARHEGVVGLIHKATEGSGDADTKAEARVFLAKDAGMLTGLYHVLTNDNVRSQAKHFLATAESLGLENNWLLAVQPGDGVTGEKVSDFLKEVEKESRRSPVLYCGIDFLKKFKNQEKVFSQYRLWLAQYETKAEVPVAFGKYFLWQYTNNGTVSGVTPPVNCSDALAESDELLAKAWSGSATGADDTLPEAPPIEETSEASQPIEPTMTPEGELDNAPAEGSGAAGGNEETDEHPPQPSQL
jgi:lysozyme